MHTVTITKVDEPGLIPSVKLTCSCAWELTTWAHGAKANAMEHIRDAKSGGVIHNSHILNTQEFVR